MILFISVLLLNMKGQTSVSRRAVPGEEISEKGALSGR
jgi:hypothetical protein